ncbi:fizzy-related protein homolog [Dromiciops gliroides]|uniref:fizzy-related protein homolog n=1 Tax=Dromiciops gliroides TaxID=33562 RepID=UPI001CC691BD|nr:fizzy-related protein homolog [Dromiciops gliroides]
MASSCPAPVPPTSTSSPATLGPLSPVAGAAFRSHMVGPVPEKEEVAEEVQPQAAQRNWPWSFVLLGWWSLLRLPAPQRLRNVSLPRQPLVTQSSFVPISPDSSHAGINVSQPQAEWGAGGVVLGVVVIDDEQQGLDVDGPPAHPHPNPPHPSLSVSPKDISTGLKLTLAIGHSSIHIPGTRFCLLPIQVSSPGTRSTVATLSIECQGPSGGPFPPSRPAPGETPREIQTLRELDCVILEVKPSWRLTLPSSPMSSPVRFGDRFIPSRAGANWNLRFHREDDPERSLRQKENTKDNSGGGNQSELVYSALLENELLGSDVQRLRVQIATPEDKNLFTYFRNTKRWRPADEFSQFSLSSISTKSQILLTNTSPPPRKIPGTPFKVLEAPDLRDDFYLNLLDWSALNMVTVGLGSFVYLWNARSGQVTRLCDLTLEGDVVTSVSCSEQGKLVGVGTEKGFIQIWDATVGKKVSTMEGHLSRVGALAWYADQISSGSKDARILQRDIRASPLQSQRWLQGHRQEVCGLKWSTNHQLLASGGNDKKLLVWNQCSRNPIQQYTNHKAAVKAIAWSPHQHGLLASGGGTNDRCIRFWNTLTGQALQHIDTGSQVCNLAWSKNYDELVSTHGYAENQILIWKYPSLTQVADLKGHAYRVLYLAVSPDGESIVTGAGDKTLRFWNVFPKSRSKKKCVSVLDLFTRIR